MRTTPAATPQFIDYFMRTFIFLFSIFMSSLPCEGQSAFISRFPKVSVEVKLADHSFQSLDSVKFLLTVTNRTDSSQKLLFDRPKMTYPWGTFVTIIDRITNDTVTEAINREMLSSKIYSEQELKDLRAFETLKSGASISQSYFLANLAILKDYKQDLPPGKYKCVLSYYGNISNTFDFTIDKKISR